MAYYTIEQEARWEQPTRVRPVGRGGAVHTLHPDTGKPYCGKPAGRELTETELNSNVPLCRACLDEHSMLVYSERHDAFWNAHPRPRLIARSNGTATTRWVCVCVHDDGCNSCGKCRSHCSCGKRAAEAYEEPVSALT